MCPISNGFRDRAMSLHSPKIVDKKEVIRTVSKTGIYRSSDSWCSLRSIIHFRKSHRQQHSASRVRTWHVARLYNVQCTVQ
jgi:hypothetical protein